MGNINNLVSSLPPQVWGLTTIVTAFSVTTLIAICIIWTLIWKGLALWRAARSGAKIWFVVLLVVNTVGLLDILYFFFIHKKKWGKK
ncbi:MAG TPA: DUF5652 family protein [Candidatus Paceibacterota bacterium]|nr:DUF5652 family protein [Candidatus Paceibacterota bacterium]